MTSTPKTQLDWIDLIYSAVEDPNRWDDLLMAFKERMEAVVVTLAIQYAERPEMSVTKYQGATEQELIEYQTKWAAQDPWMTRIIFGQYPIGQFVCSQEICPDEELEATEFYREFSKPRQHHYGGGVYLTNGANQKSVFGFNRPKRCGPLRRDELDFLNGLIPHMCRAVRLHGEREKIRAERDALLNYLDSGAIGIVLMTEQARVLASNRTADEWIGEGRPLYLEHERLRLKDCGLQEKVLGGIAEAGARIRTQPSSMNQFQIGSLTAIVLPALESTAAQIATNMPTVVLYLIDPARSKPISPEVIMRVMPLTRTEAAVAARLASGESLEQAAEFLHISPHTIRTHLKRIFSKTGCIRQAELVAVILRLVSHMPASPEN